MTDRQYTGATRWFVVLICIGAVVAQTFQYSRGWTNGKKRAGSAPQVFQQPLEANDVLGICQMMRLKEILAQKKSDQVVLPCEVMMEPEDEVRDRFRRKVADYENSSLDGRQDLH